MIRYRRTLAVFVLTILLGGCAGLHLYNEEDAKLATQAKDNYAKIDPQQLIVAARANLEKLRDAEIARTRENIEYLRDLTLYDMMEPNLAEYKASLKEATSLIPTKACTDKKAANEPLPKGGCYVQERIAQLGFKDETDIKDTLKSFVVGPLGPEWIRELTVPIERQTKWNVPECDKLPQEIPADRLQGRSDAAKGALRAQFETIKRRCANPDGPIIELSKKPSIGLAETAKKIVQVKTAISNIEAGKKSIDKAIKDAEDALKAAAGEAGADAADRKKALIETVKNLRKTVGSRLDKATVAARKIGVEDRLADLQIEKIDILLAAAEGEEVSESKLNDDESLRKAALVAQTVPGLAAEIGAAVDAWKAPSLASLLIAKGQALVDKQNAAARKALLERRLQLHRATLKAQLLETNHLKDAHDLAVKSADLIAKSKALSASGNATDKALAKQMELSAAGKKLRAYAKLSQAFVPARLEAETAKYQEIHYDAEAIMDANEYALRSWDNLVRTPIEVLNAYHDAGIKPQELADLLIKAGGLGILGILAGRVD